MPKLKSDLLNEELPRTNKVTIMSEVNDSKTISDENENKSNINIYDLIKKEVKKEPKELVGVTLEKETVDKLKTVVMDSNTNMSKLFEELLSPLLKDVVINEENIKAYNKKNKGKGRRTKK